MFEWSNDRMVQWQNEGWWVFWLESKWILTYPLLVLVLYSGYFSMVLCKCVRNQNHWAHFFLKAQKICNHFIITYNSTDLRLDKTPPLLHANHRIVPQDRSWTQAQVQSGVHCPSPLPAAQVGVDMCARVGQRKEETGGNWCLCLSASSPAFTVQ